MNESFNKREKWDRRFLSLAREIASWSKDPSTKVGAVIVDWDKRIVSTGYNGFPVKVVDTEERLKNRELKYAFTVHAEMNAILFAGRSVAGCTLYTYPFMPCDRCAAAIVQAKLVDVVSVEGLDKERAERWSEAFQRSRLIFREAGVPVRFVEM